MWFVNLLIALLLQTPLTAGRVVAGLIEGRQVVVDDPEYSGFIEGRGAGAVLMYRRHRVQGQMPVSAISRIDFLAYRKGMPFALAVTLKNGQKVEVQADGPNFVTVKGKSDIGTVLIRHPDPISPPLRLTTTKPDRAKDLTIRYLEFPAPSE
jgi:hypothetical protein